MLQSRMTEMTLSGEHICLQARFPTRNLYALALENAHPLLNTVTIKRSLAHKYVCKYARTLTSTKSFTQEQLQEHTFRQ
jgi:hypothetical protein